MRRMRFLAATVVVAVVVVTWAVPGSAGSHQVTNGNDSGPGSYRQAVLDAAADVDPVTISFDPGLTVTLTATVAYGGTQPLTIEGNGSTIDANGFQALTSTPPVALSDLTVQNGEGPAGGAILVGAAFTATNATFTDNQTVGAGGAVAAAGPITIVDSTFTRNEAQVGGAVFAAGGIDVRNSTFTGNTALLGGAIGGADATGGSMIVSSTFGGNQAVGGAGGAVAMASISLAIIDSEISGGSANAGGGVALGGTIRVPAPAPAEPAGGAVEGLTFEGGRVEMAAGEGPSGTVDLTLTIDGSTFAGNNAVQGGAVVAADVIDASDPPVLSESPGVGSFQVSATNSTFAGNEATLGGGIAAPFSNVSLTYVTATDSAPGGAEVQADSLSTRASVFAPTAGPACDAGSTISMGDNYETGDTCGLTGTRDTADGGDPALAALADNGGPTPTRQPAVTSPLLDSIPESTCAEIGIDVDQRDEPRPTESDGDETTACDVGAVEPAFVPPPGPQPGPSPGPISAAPPFAG